LPHCKEEVPAWRHIEGGKREEYDIINDLQEKRSIFTFALSFVGKRRERGKGERRRLKELLTWTLKNERKKEDALGSINALNLCYSRKGGENVRLYLDLA